MPYINKEWRNDISLIVDDFLDELLRWEERNHDEEMYDMETEVDGLLNYVITRVLLRYRGYLGERYHTYERLIGLLECIKQELYRRSISKYEDGKIESEGDVYD